MSKGLKKFFLILTCIVVTISILGTISYLKNLDQNAFSLCELVICAYCALSIVFKFKTLENTDTIISLNKTDSIKENSKQDNNSNNNNPR